MAIAARLDDPAARERFAAWLAAQVGTASVELTALPGPAFSGFSNETALFDATWEVGAARSSLELAVRLEPSGHQVFPETLFETQVRVLRALEGTPVPAPTVRWFEPDPAVLGSAFFVMDRLTGRAPPDNPPYHVAGWLLEADPELRARLWWNGLEAMSAVHRLDPEALELGFVERADAAGRLAADRAYVEWALDGRAYPLVEDALDRLTGTVPPPPAPGPAFCWGDSRIGNVLYDDDGSVVAVLDWEMVSIGDPVNDLAWFLLIDRHHSEACGMPRLDGFPPHAETVARWETLAGRPAAALEWWTLLGAVRYAAIVTRVLDLLDDTGVFPGAREAMSLENTSTILLRAVLQRPLLDG